MPKYKKRKDGRYATTVATGRYDENGNPIKKTLYGRTIAELEDKIREVKNQLADGIQVQSKDVTFKQYASIWLETHKASKSYKTKETYEGTLKNHMEILDHLSIKSITATHIQQQVNSVKDKPRTARLVLLTCKQIFKSAMNDRLINFNPCYGIDLPRYEPVTKRALTDAEKQAVKTAIYTPIEKAFIMTLYCTGMRPAEVYALTWRDIDFNHGTITVNKSLNFVHSQPILAVPKTASGTRVIETHTMALQALKEWQRHSGSLIVFSSHNGTYMCRSSYKTLFESAKEKIEKALGHPTEITAYYFRHNFCTELYYSGVSLKEAVRLMGHSDTTMIMKIYAHLDATKEDTATKINAIHF